MWKPSPVQEVIARRLYERMLQVPTPRDNKPVVLVGFSLKSEELTESLQTIPKYVGIRIADVHTATILANQHLVEVGADVAVYYDELSRGFYTSHSKR